MILGLDLYPFQQISTYLQGSTRLSVQNDGWAEAIQASDALKNLPASTEFKFYPDNGNPIRTESSPAGRFKWMTVGELLTVPLLSVKNDDFLTLLPFTKAAREYFALLPADYAVVLYFH